VIPARWVAVLLAFSLAASPALADPGPGRAPDPAQNAPAKAAPSRSRLQGRALLLARLPEPRIQVVPLPQPVPMSTQAIEEPKPLDRWWFWAVAAGLVLATATLFLVATSGTEQPSTMLGNMEAFD
jgi:hypothetical protein